MKISVIEIDQDFDLTAEEEQELKNWYGKRYVGHGVLRCGYCQMSHHKMGELSCIYCNQAMAEMKCTGT